MPRPAARRRTLQDRARDGRSSSTAFRAIPKMHPCGVVLSRQPMHELTPTLHLRQGLPHHALRHGRRRSHRPGEDGHPRARRAGRDARRESDARQRDIAWTWNRSAAPPMSTARTLDALEPWDDPQVWEMIASGSARAVHHIESPAMISPLPHVQRARHRRADRHRQRHPPRRGQRRQEAGVHAALPGAGAVHYPHPSLEPCLRSTFGLVVYEEHILQICEAFAGLPPGPRRRAAPRAGQTEARRHRGDSRRSSSPAPARADTTERRSPKSGIW